VEATEVLVVGEDGARTGSVRRLSPHTRPAPADAVLLLAWAAEADARVADESARGTCWTRFDTGTVLRSMENPGPASADAFMVQDLLDRAVGVIAFTGNWLNFAFRSDEARGTTVILDAAAALAAQLDVPLWRTDASRSGLCFWNRLCRRIGWKASICPNT